MSVTGPYDAVVVGAGPNGLTAAITLQQQGLSVLLVEAAATIGGGSRTAALTLPGFLHDVCAAVHPMAALSPVFQRMPLEAHGLHLIYPEIDCAHPLDNGSAAVLKHSLDETARGLGADDGAYRRLVEPVARAWDGLARDLLGPLSWPRHPLDLGFFGLKALAPATRTVHRFHTEAARALWGGLCFHGQIPFQSLSSSAVAMVLTVAAHKKGWPVPAGGSQKLADALAGYFQTLGGRIETGLPITRLDQLPAAKALLFDLSPKQLLAIAGDQFTPFYRRQLRGYRYGIGVFKVDWALSGPVPFTAPECRRAGTIHLGGRFEELAAAEKQIWTGGHPERPGVLLAQPSISDPGRAPEGKQAVWAYCHVPLGSEKDMTTEIENQVERFAPGFRDLILARHTMNTRAFEEYNANYIGGDINGGSAELGQLFTRPALRSSPYRSSAKGIYLCSASTPPGGGVHGMGGYHSARQALNDIFGISVSR